MSPRCVRCWAEAKRIRSDLAGSAAIDAPSPGAVVFILVIILPLAPPRSRMEAVVSEARMVLERIVSYYDYPKLKSLGETAFIKELIPHID